MEAQTQVPTLEESTIVERVARIVSSVRGKNSDYTRLASELESSVPFDIFGVVLLRHDRQAVRVMVCQQEGDRWKPQNHQHPFKDSMVEQIIKNPVLRVNNYPEGLDGSPARSGDALSGCHQVHSTLIAPLLVGERVLGALELGSIHQNTYADENLQRLIWAVVRVLAAAIESAQDGGSVEIQDRQREVLKAVSSAITSTASLSAILQRIVDGIAETLNMASAVVILDRWNQKLRVEAQARLDPVVLQRLVVRKEALSEQCIIGATLRSHQTISISEQEIDEEHPLNCLFMTDLGLKTLSSHPLISGNAAYGTLLLCSSETGGLTPLKADILSLFASQATIAIRNSMLLESTEKRQRFQKALENLEQAKLQKKDEHALLERVRQESEQAFGVSFSSLLRFISDHLLTQSERDLHNLLGNEQAEWALESPIALNSDDPKSQDESFSLLTQTAEQSLDRVSMLSELSRLLQIYEQGSGNLSDAWLLVDLEGYCIYLNPAAEAITGKRLNPTEPLEYTLDAIFASLMTRVRNREESRAYFNEFIHGNPVRQDLRCVFAVEPTHVATNVPLMKNRKPLVPESAPSDHHYHLKRYPLYGQSERYIGNALQMCDITAQVRDEKNKSVLLSSVSHDLRTPLTTIKAAVTGLLQPGIVWDEQVRNEILEEINVEADHLTVLVNALVEMSRIEMGALVLEKEWCDLIEIAHNTLARTERLLAGREIRTDFQRGLPLVQVDYVQLERVFYNLIENAARHSPANSPITITIASHENTLRVQVVDKGYGVPEGERERIFQTFYSLNSQGNGLGLAICRGIIDAHQGKIWVEPADGSGSRFIFTLPVSIREGAPWRIGSSQTNPEEH
ncbi:MAG TPA: ATP-binding protein [Ktedonobacteraceae bacterium]|nr:ATP-binding protein [Ktedonobacteraceae bacterium]